MADRRTYKRQTRSMAAYQYGNAARQLDEYVVSNRKEEKQSIQVQYEKRVPAYGALYTFFLILSAAFMIFSACSYMEEIGRAHV